MTRPISESLLFHILDKSSVLFLPLPLKIESLGEFLRIILTPDSSRIISPRDFQWILELLDAIMEDGEWLFPLKTQNCITAIERLSHPG